MSNSSVADDENFGDDGPHVKGPRGFSAIDPAYQKQIAARGGRASHQARSKGYKAGDDAGFVVGEDVNIQADDEYVPQTDPKDLPGGGAIARDALRDQDEHNAPGMQLNP
eukprot:ANDGO_04726.mRNA.1 hypothetical protein